MDILLTGASGFLGSAVIPALKAAYPGSRLRALLLPGEKPGATIESSCEIVEGDVRDKASIARAARGMSHVIHMAGVISYAARDAALLEAVNVVGARNVAEACADEGAHRLVHLSSVGALGFHRDGRLADESVPSNWPDGFHYMRTKRMGEEAALSQNGKGGLEVIVINPASIIGPGDPAKGSPHNRLYGQMMALPFFFGTFTGGLALVDVRDLAAIVAAALTKGRPGERYLACGANLRYAEVLTLMGKHCGKRVIAFPVPSWLLTLAGLAAEAVAGNKGPAPLITAAYGRLSGWKAYYDGSKASREFSVTYRSPDESIRDAAAFYRARFLGGSDGQG